MSKQTNLIFVYGTLMGNLDKHVPARFKDLGEYQGKLYDLGACPGVHPSDNEKDIVKGEVFELDSSEHTLRILDYYEGVPSGLYRRELVRINLAQCKMAINCWIYLFNHKVDEKYRIKSGLWN